MQFLASLVQRLILLPDTGSLVFGFRLITIVLQKRTQILFTDRATPTIRGMVQIGGGVGSGGGIIALLYTENYGCLRVYFVVQILPFIDWTCSAVRAREEWRATAEMTLSLQVHLVLSDTAATRQP